MIEVAGLGLTAGVIGWSALRLHGLYEERQRRLARGLARIEDERRSACDEVLRACDQVFGSTIRQAMSRQELRRLIDGGITPDDLASLLLNRYQTVSGLALGHHLAVDGLEIKLEDALRTRHVYVVGRTGSGKTTLIRNLILQDLEAGHGLAILAPEQELLTDELFPYIPSHRINDIIYINPVDTECPVILNPLHLDPGEDLDLKVDEVLTTLLRLFAEDGGGAAPRMEAILRHSLYLLVQIPGSTLLDFPKLLNRQRDDFRRWAVTQCPDPEIRQFWTETYPSYPKDAHLPLTNRLSRFLRPRMIRNLLCSPGPSLNVRQAMDTGKVLCFPLSDGILGETNAKLLGQLITSKIQLAAMSRADIPQSQRRPFFVYLDEFQSFVNVAATSYEKLLSRSRKFNVGLVLAHQQIGQIPESLMRDILGNVGTLVSFQVGATDARRLCRDLVGEVGGEFQSPDPKELISLRVGEACVRTGRRVMILKTFPPPEGGDWELRDQVIARSREQYGYCQQGQELSLNQVPLDQLNPGEVFE